MQAENAGTASAAAPETADAPSEPMPDDWADLLLFGAADQVRDILLLIPTSSNISFAPFRTLLSIFALLAAAAILVGGWFSRSIGEGTDPHRHEAGRPGTPEEETASRIESAKTDGSGSAADTALARSLAEITRGEVIPPGGTDGFFRSMREKKESAAEPVRYTRYLCDNWLVFALGVALLSVEWLLRKVWGRA